MARRSYYPSSYCGFADGFTQGFGLVQNQYNTEREMALEERRLSEQAARDERQFKETQAKLDRAYGLSQRQLNADIAAAEAAAKEAAASANFRREQTERETNLAAVRAETELLEAQQTSQEMADAAALKAKQEYMAQATQGMADLSMMLQAPVGTYSYDQILEAVKATQGGALDIYKFLDPKFQADFANLTSTLQQGLNDGTLDLNNRAVLDGLSAMFDSKRGQLVGKTVDGTFPNAPEEYKTGDWVVADRFVTDVRQNEQDPSMLNATVSVRLVHKETGESAYYDAPMTEGRGSQSGPVGVPIKEALDGVAGTSMLIQEIEKFRPRIEEAIIQKKFGGDNLKFQNQVNEEVERTMKLAAEDPDGRSIVPTKKNSSLRAEDHASVARSKILGVSGEKLDFAGDRLRVITEARQEFAPILSRALLPSEVDGGDPQKIKFSNAEVLRMIAMPNRAALEAYIQKLAKNKGGYLSGAQEIKVRGRGIGATANRRSEG